MLRRQRTDRDHIDSAQCSRPDHSSNLLGQQSDSSSALPTRCPGMAKGRLMRHAAGAVALLSLLSLALTGCGESSNPRAGGNGSAATATAAATATVTTAATATTAAATTPANTVATTPANTVAPPSPTGGAQPTTGTGVTGVTLAAAHPSYEVGAYYFSGWSHGQNNNINPLLTRTFAGSEPLTGWYDDTQQEVDQTVKQAADAGIGFFAFDWYDIALSSSQTDRTLNEALGFYLRSPQRPRLKFALMYVDQAPFIPVNGKLLTQEQWAGLVKTWIGYFKMPGYVQVGGKPLFIVFSPEHLLDIMGGPPNVRKALDYLRAQARAAGLPGVTVAVCATVAPHSNPGHTAEIVQSGYDMATGYNYHSLGKEKYRAVTPYDALVRENMGVWNRAPERMKLPYMPVVTSGWDQRYSIREQATAIIYGPRTPQKFACFAVQARHWIDTHPTETPAERIVMIFAWNEIGEGGAIIPTHQDSYAYANAVHTVFGGNGQAPVTPPDCQ